MSPITCERCGKECRDREAWLHHLKTHDPQVECGVCGALFPDQRDMARHRDSRHSAVKVSRKCRLCNRSAGRSDIALRHMHRFHADKGVSTVAEALVYFDESIVSNVTERSHNCSKCGAGFTQAGSRNRHERECAGV